MEVILKSRGQGKTAELIRQSSESNGYIVCRNLQECARIASVAKSMGLKIPFPITYDEFTTGAYYAKGVKSVLIDQADHLLQGISKVPIVAVTLDK